MNHDELKARRDTRPHGNLDNVLPIDRRLRIDEAQHPEKCEAVVLSIYEKLIRGSEDDSDGAA